MAFFKMEAFMSLQWRKEIVYLNLHLLRNN